MSVSLRYMRCLQLLSLVIAVCLTTVSSKLVSGTGILAPNDAVVEAKFCYDVSQDPERKPGDYSFVHICNCFAL
jgi:hypothetical protein